jgi:hypothetical protein
VIGLVVGGIVGLALVVVLVVLDTSLVVQAHERSASSTLAAVVIAVAAALGTVLAFAWYRGHVGDLGTHCAPCARAGRNRLGRIVRGRVRLDAPKAS